MTDCGIMGVVVFTADAKTIWCNQMGLGINHVHGWANVLKHYKHRSMKQSVAESRRSETRPLNECKNFDEHNTQRKSSGAFILLSHSRPLPLLTVEHMWCKQRSLSRYILMFCYNATLCVRHLSNKTYNILKRFWCFQVNQGCMMPLAGDARTLWTRSVSLV